MSRAKGWTAAAALPLAALLSGCTAPSGPEPAKSGGGSDEYGGYNAESSTTSEAERTREMDERAREMERMAREGRDPNAGAADQQRAYEEFERERQKLNAQGERRADDAGGGESDDGGQ